jgi:hypothetical protein
MLPNDTPRTCIDCGVPVYKKSKRCRVCHPKHWGRIRATPLDDRLVGSYAERDMGYVTPCWVWQRSTDRKGYGHINPGKGKKMIQAHKYFFERRNGKVGRGVDLHHLCEVPLCVNPDHLEPLSRVEHMRSDGRRDRLIARNRGL